MAFYHHSLYFQLEQSSQAFKDSPPGTINVSRLVQGKSNYWVDPNSELAQHKKTLFFADFLAFASKDLDQIKKQFNQLLHDLSNVTTLDLRECAKLTNDDLERILERATNIEKLTIHDCKSLSLNLKNINKLRHLKQLDLSHIKINQDELDNILKIATDLESLELKHCNDNDLTISEDLDGKKADNPGFMVIGTQNPASLSGRRQASQALERRLIKVDLPPYTKNEMQIILDESGFDQSETIQMVEAYEKAKENNRKLVFRDLMKFAKALTESRHLSEYATTTDKKMKERETDLDELLGDFINSGAPEKDLDHHEFDAPKLKHPFTFIHNVSTTQNQTNNIEVEV
ncbi:MAG: hypothetical protein EP298_12740 [Gammaproteobacteria bacterium]|nr:MAG: hypothetical protein EP298_12740 [Gammaproteobacteria bacterium]UTW41676.1 hypothetical protein KFE69_09180 [bacterium SCSIO 12844]